MVVTKTAYTHYVTLTGTLAEVIGALSNECVLPNRLLSLVWNGTTYVAVYWI